MRKPLIYLFIGIAIGVAAAREYKTVINFVRGALVSAGITKQPPSPRVAKGRDRLQKNPVSAPCPDPKRERVAVLLTAGQSNAANHGAVNEPNDAKDNPAILNLLDGKCFIARHPLMGATGEYQSPWIETARLLIASGKFDKVVIIATGIGGTGMHEWGSGEFFNRLVARAVEAKEAGIAPTHFLWHQGEYDGVYNLSPVAYFDNFKKMIEGVRAIADIPAHIALVSRCQFNQPKDEIRSAQLRIAQLIPNAYVAIDSDMDVGLAFRYDGCHMTRAGLAELAKGYARSILR